MSLLIKKMITIVKSKKEVRSKSTSSLSLSALAHATAKLVLY
jgi:hypothetical protein